MLDSVICEDSQGAASLPVPTSMLVDYHRFYVIRDVSLDVFHEKYVKSTNLPITLVKILLVAVAKTSS